MKQFLKSAITDMYLQNAVVSFPAFSLKYEVQQNLLQRWQHRYLFPMNHESFQKHLYSINKRDFPFYVCDCPSTSLHYVFNYALYVPNRSYNHA